MSGPGSQHESRTSSAGGHVLISGTGRAGTTLLVQYLTELGFDTGFDRTRIAARLDAISHAGLEHSLVSAGRLPYVAKAPGFANLGPLLDAGELTVKACVLPMRDLFEAAESRREVSRRAADAGRDARRQPGGLAFQAQRHPERQEERLAVKFHALLHTLVRHGVPVYFLCFPDFARDHDELYDALAGLLVAHGVDRGESAAAYAAVVRPELIHEFRPESDTSS